MQPGGQIPPEDDAFNPALSTWGRDLTLVSISGHGRLPAPGGLPHYEDSAMSYGMVDPRTGKDMRRLERETQIPAARDEFKFDCGGMLALLRGQMDGEVPDAYGGGKVRRMVPTCRVCQGIVDRAARDRANSPLWVSWEDSIADAAATRMGGSLCGWCRRKVADLQRRGRYSALSRAEYIRALMLIPYSY